MRRRLAKIRRLRYHLLMIRRPRSPHPVFSRFSWTAAVLAAAGLALCARGWSLGIGRAAAPGPGLWPAVVGGGLALSGALMPAISGGGAEPGRRQIPDARALRGLLLGCAAWLLFFTSLGWLPATFTAGLIFGRSAGNAWLRCLLLILLLIATLGLGVEYLLGFPLPDGLWGRAFAALTAWLSGAGGPA